MIYKNRLNEYNKKINNINIWQISLKYSKMIKFKNINSFKSIYKNFLNELKSNNNLNYKHKSINVWLTLYNTIKKKNNNNTIINALHLFHYTNIINNIQ